jgi:uncharacterized protein (TIGR02646 family)
LRRINFNPTDRMGWSEDQASSWDAWLAKADRAKKAALDDYTAKQKPKLNEQVWAELKKWLLRHIFHGKCAYCEIRISGGFFGEGEHYRPKSKVTMLRNGVRVTIEPDKPHPGYFWLAYDWQNLIPACQECNNRKSDQFPAKEHIFAPSSSDDQLDEIEQPLLLHPYRDEPSKHIRFGKFGIVAPVDDSAVGKATIDVLGLNREHLSEHRREKQEQAHIAFQMAMIDFLTKDISLPQNEALQRYTCEKAEFSAAVRDYIECAHKALVNRINNEPVICDAHTP